MTNLFKFSPLAGGLFALILSACSSMQVNTSEAPNADLSNYHTYSWADQGKQSSAQSSMMDQTVKADVDKQLPSKGLVPAQGAQQPDLLISYSAKSKNSVEYGAAPGYWGGEYAYPVREGQLTLHFIDPKTNRVVWQGSASDVVGDAGASQKQVADAVKAIIEKYPA